jgi:hypothetical protein
VKSAMIALVLIGFVSVGRADVVVEVDSTLLAPGTTGIVSIYAKPGDRSPIALQSFGLKLQISSIAGSGAGVLNFVDPQPNDTQTQSGYLFAGNTDSGHWTSNVSLDFLTVTLGDFTADETDVDLSIRKLLARVQVQHITPHPNLTIGDVFNLSVVDDGSTVFVDADGNTKLFSSSPGNLTIITPEPSTVGLLSAGSLLMFWTLQRNSRGRLILLWKSRVSPLKH